MGGGSSHQKQLNECRALIARYEKKLKHFQFTLFTLSQTLNKMASQIEKINDPSQRKIKIQQVKELYWKELNQQQFQLHKGKSVIFIGRTSVGKSSLLNTLFKTNLKTSKTSCTKEISIVTNIDNITIFDCPGLDEHFDICKQPENVPRYLGPMQNVYYLYDGYIEEDIVKTLMAMKKNIFFVRTKCDPDDSPEENDEVRTQDYARLNKIGCNSMIFLTSKKGGVDNGKLLNHILDK